MSNKGQNDVNALIAHKSITDLWGEISPTTALICGSGWSDLGNLFTPLKSTNYREINGMTSTTVEGHNGVLTLCDVNQKQILIFQGRRHWYEGEGWGPIKLPVELAHLFGVKNLILTNAAGGINKDFKVGELMVLNDHLNLMDGNPLIGPVSDDKMPRFPDQSCVYNTELRTIAMKAGEMTDLNLNEGVYAALNGPAFETPAEINALRILGADAVGMSTVPEAMIGNGFGMKVHAISFISNMAAGMTSNKLSHKDVENASKLAMPKIIKFFKCFLELIHK